GGRLRHQRRNEHDRDLEGLLVHRLAGRGKDRQAEMAFPRALRIDAAHDASSALYHLFGPERALLARHALDEDFGGPAQDQVHWRVHRAASTAACTASSIKS